MDIAPGIASSFPGGFVELGNRMLFFASGELWVSDGTPGGTRFLAGDPSSSSSYRTIGSGFVWDGFLYYIFDRYLWRTDGTTPGTEQVFPISTMRAYAVMNNNLYYFSDYSQLWRYDGANSTLIYDYGSASGTGLKNTSPFYVFQGRIYFVASDGQAGYELWSTDGTAQGTGMVRDIRPGAEGTFASYATVSFESLGNEVFFFANDGAQGLALWATDGTAQGTRLIKSGEPSAAGYYNLGYFANRLVKSNGLLFFTGTTFVNGEYAGAELWASDGTEQGTSLVKEIWPGKASALDDYNQKLLAYNGGIYFVANDGQHGPELWKSDGTSSGTTLVNDINVGARGSQPVSMTLVNNELYFSADDGLSGYEIWTSNGTRAGTRLIADINQLGEDTESSRPYEFTEIGPYVLFTATASKVEGRQLWRTDGTESGTQVINAVNPFGGAQIYHLTKAGGYVYFAGLDGSSRHSFKLWRSDGTENGTMKLVNSDGEPNVSNATEFTAVGNSVFFLAFAGGEYKLWRSQGTIDSTRPVYGFPDYFTPSGRFLGVGNRLFFVYENAQDITELWVSDGSEAGTRMIMPISSPIGYSCQNPFEESNWAELNGYLYFTAYDDSQGVGLWKTNGTASGTTKLVDVDATRGPADNEIPCHKLVATSDHVYFIRNDGDTGYQLWRTNGASGGEELVTESIVDAGNQLQSNLVEFNDKVFFNVGFDGQANYSEFWVTDGRDSGTFKLGEFDEHNANPFYNHKRTKDYLYFTVHPVSGSEELWRTDGSVNGTHRVKDFSDSRYGGFQLN
jgi:ELWxxDGT repeat protein